ncbi:hypothetical protein FNO01nite_04980 [Flavobacterium noncentrifugens]|nr:hypothetical protein FNO01nite_04980 [Flavobacterium noncentrifugens]
MCSCTVIKFAKNQNIIPKAACASIGNYPQPYFEVELQGKKKLFLFDTGATGTVLTDSTAIENFTNKKFATFGTHVSANGVKKKNRFLTAGFKSPLFESAQKLLLYSPMPTSMCSKSSEMAGILGIDAFFQDDMPLFLNFSKNEICNIETTLLQNQVSQGFKAIKSECKNNQIFVFIDIEGKMLKFKLDTGFSGSVIIPFSDKLQFTNPNYMVLQGSTYNTLSSMTAGTETFYEKMPVDFAGEKFEAKINVSSTIKSQNLGIQFMKGYDWIIDFKNNKVYIRRNANIIDRTFSRRISYYAKAVSSELVIVTKEKSQDKYNLGDKIISVNGQKVNHENVCEIQEYLNKTEDWNALQLEVHAK